MYIDALKTTWLSGTICTLTNKVIKLRGVKLRYIHIYTPPYEDLDRKYSVENKVKYPYIYVSVAMYV